jgi:hypothetical protein
MSKTKEASRARLEDRERARQFVHRVVVKDFGQTLDEETLDSIAEKVLRSLPQRSRNEEELQA